MERKAAIISIHAEKHHDLKTKKQQQKPSKLGIKNNFLKLIKAIYQKPKTNILNGERLNPLHL